MPQGAQVQLLKVVRRGLDADLKLIVVLQAERVVAIAPVGGTARRLDVRRTPRLRAYGAQKSGRVEGARAHFHVVGLQNDAAPPGPVCLQCKNELLKGAGQPGESLGHGMLAKDKAASIATPHSSVLGFTAHSIRSLWASGKAVHQKVAHIFSVCSIMMQTVPARDCKCLIRLRISQAPQWHISCSSRQSLAGRAPAPIAGHNKLSRGRT